MELEDGDIDLAVCSNQFSSGAGGLGGGLCSLFGDIIVVEMDSPASFTALTVYSPKFSS